MQFSGTDKKLSHSAVAWTQKGGHYKWGYTEYILLQRKVRRTKKNLIWAHLDYRQTLLNMSYTALLHNEQLCANSAQRLPHRPLMFGAECIAKRDVHSIS